jgi:cell volume regulation protein A
MEALFHAHAALLFGSALVLLGILSSLLASRFGVPLLLVFLGVGMLAGEDGPGAVAFGNYGMTYMVGSAALAIILFDGGLRTRFVLVKAVLAPAGLLASAGVAVTAGLTGLAAALLFRLDWIPALLVGAIVASTDAAVVFFLLRSGGLQLKRRVGAMLEVESSTNDPFAVLLTVILVELALGSSGGGSAAHIAGEIVFEVALGLAMGFAGGALMTLALNRLTLPSGLHPVFVIACAMVLFALTQLAGASGFLCVYVAGLVLGNRPLRAYASIVSFHDAATWLCQIVMFTLLGLLVTPSKLVPLLAPATALALFLIFVGRPAAVFASLAPFGFSRREMTFVSWVGLRGGVSIFLATIPVLAGLPASDLFFNIAFVVVVVSLVLQGWTVPAAARRLGVALRDAAPAVQRIDLDLPGQLDSELVGYPVLVNSAAARHRALPSWVKPVLVVRGGEVMQASEAGALVPRDYAYFLAPTRRLARLDRFFAVDGSPATPEPLPEFPFDANLKVGEVALLYGLDAGSGETGQSIADLFAERLDGVPQEGDRIDLGAATLIAHDVMDDRVRLAGLVLEAEPESEEDAAARPPAGLKERLGAALASGLRQLRGA